MIPKKIFFIALSVLFVMVACGEKEAPENPVVINPPKPKDSVPPATTVVYKKPQIDSIRDLMKTIDRYKDVLRDSVWKDSSGVTFYYAYAKSRIPATDANNAIRYPGAFVDMNDFKNGKYAVLPGYPSKPLWILSEAPEPYFF